MIKFIQKIEILIKYINLYINYSIKFSISLSRIVYCFYNIKSKFLVRIFLFFGKFHLFIIYSLLLFIFSLFIYCLIFIANSKFLLVKLFIIFYIYIYIYWILNFSNYFTYYLLWFYFPTESMFFRNISQSWMFSKCFTWLIIFF